VEGVAAGSDRSLAIRIKIQNPKHEIRNKSKIQMTEIRTKRTEEVVFFGRILNSFQIRDNRVRAAGFRAFPLIAIIAGVCGCMVGPDFKRPAPAMPMGWSGPATQPTTRASVTVAAPADVAAWWRNFNDPILNSLIERAISSNLDLRQAESRLRQARAQRDVTAAGFWPQANVSTGYRRQGSDGGQVRATSAGTVTSSRGSSDQFNGAFDASWELDVFGGVRRQIEAADANIQFAHEDLRDALVSLTSEVALNYLDLRGFQRQIAIAQENLKSQQYSADLTRRRQAGGLVNGLDVANADATLASTEAGIPVLEQNARQTIYNISLLLGQQPQALVSQLAPSAQIPSVPAEVPVGLPSQLLRRRPDIRRAEASLHAATAQVGVAIADLFPRFSLTGSISSSGGQFQNVWNWNNAFWSIGPSVSWPIFSAGSIRANIRVQNEVQAQAATTYEQTVLTALNEVESALVAYAREQQHRTALEQAVTANRRAVQLSQQLYQQGQTDFLNVLTAQRSLLGAEDALVQSNRTVATDLVALYKALGGGWQSTEQATTQPIH
jgi:NodT family efflux transporter outer membrane factor (OMF) lipoprotein